MNLSRGARGELVRLLQRGLVAHGYPLVPDAVFGPRTEAAVAASQTGAGLSATGVVDASTWTAVTHSPVPSLFERALNLVACFEGHGYTKAAGNWDGAGITWGIIGFTMKSGSLFEVLDRIPQRILAQCLTDAGADQIMALRRLDRHAQSRFAEAISSTHTRRTTLVSTWNYRFLRLGNTPEAQAAQKQVALERYWAPAQEFREKRLSWLRSERSATLVFDCFVNQGSVFPSAVEAVRSASPNDEPYLMMRLANAQADRTVATYRENVRNRRMTIAIGGGVVHGITYDLSKFGITLE